MLGLASSWPKVVAGLFTLALSPRPLSAESQCQMSYCWRSATYQEHQHLHQKFLQFIWSSDSICLFLPLPSDWALSSDRQVLSPLSFFCGSFTNCEMLDWKLAEDEGLTLGTQHLNSGYYIRLIQRSSSKP